MIVKSKAQRMPPVKIVVIKKKVNLVKKKT